MELMEVIFISSLIINTFAFFEFWVFWYFAVKQFEGLRNFFLRNYGFGYLLIRHPENRISKVFKKLEQQMKVDNKIYNLISERVYKFENLPTLLYNFGDAMPLDIATMKHDELWRNSEWLNNILQNTKAAAEAEADAKNSLKEILIYISILFSLLAFCGVAYLIYILTNGGSDAIINNINNVPSGSIINAQP